MDVSNKQIVTLPINTDTATMNISNYILFNCNKKMDLCKQTVGYVKDDNIIPNYYSISLNSNENHIITKDTNNCNYSNGKIGTLNANDGNLCIVKSISNTVNDSILGNWSNNAYILSKPDENDSVFKEDKDKNIIIKSTANVIYKDNNYEDSDINIFIHNNKIDSIENITDDIIAKSSSLYLCERNGECQGVEGFIKNNDYYYHIDTYSPNNNCIMSSDDFVNDCSSHDDNIGNLLNAGEICVSKTKSIPFATLDSENKNYILFDKNGEEKLLRSFSNIFIKQEFASGK